MDKNFRDWRRAQRKIVDLTFCKHRAVAQMVISKNVFILKKGRMKPTPVILEDAVYGGDRVLVRRVDNGKLRWVGMHFISER